MGIIPTIFMVELILNTYTILIKEDSLRKEWSHRGRIKVFDGNAILF